MSISKRKWANCMSGKGAKKIYNIKHSLKLFKSTIEEMKKMK